MPAEKTVLLEVRCWQCRRFLGKLTAPYEVMCPKCRAINARPAGQ